MHDHDWGYSWRSSEGCRCGSCSDIDRPYLWCEFCDEELEPDHPDFAKLWAETIEKYQ